MKWSFRFRLGPFTFGRTGTRLNLFSGGTGVSIPLTGKGRTFGKIGVGPFRWYFSGDQGQASSAVGRWDFMVARTRPSDARVGDPAHLVRTRNAIEIQTKSGRQLGYVPPKDAATMLPLLDAGHPYQARIKKMLGRGSNPIPVVIVELYPQD